MAGIDAAVDGGGEHNAAARLEAHEGFAPGRVLRREVGARDGDEAAAFREPRQRRGHVAEVLSARPALDLGRGGERRVHQHDRRPDGAVEVIVDVRRVVAGDGNAGKKALEQVGARVREFVQNEARAHMLREDGEQTGAGRGFKDEVARGDRGRDARGEAERERRRELLKLRLPFRAPRLRWDERRDLGDHREQRAGRSGAGAHRLTEPAQEEDLRRLARLVGVLPHPRAPGVGGAEGELHRGPQRLGLNLAAAFEVREQAARGFK